MGWVVRLENEDTMEERKERGKKMESIRVRRREGGNGKNEERQERMRGLGGRRMK